MTYAAFSASVHIFTSIGLRHLWRQNVTFGRSFVTSDVHYINYTNIWRQAIDLSIYIFTLSQTYNMYDSLKTIPALCVCRQFPGCTWYRTLDAITASSCPCSRQYQTESYASLPFHCRSGPPPGETELRKFVVPGSRQLEKRWHNICSKFIEIRMTTMMVMTIDWQSYVCPLSQTVLSEWVSSFLTAHQHNIEYLQYVCSVILSKLQKRI